MSISVKILSIPETTSGVLSQYISTNQDNSQLPSFCQLSASEIVIDLAIALQSTHIKSISESTIADEALPQTSSDTELSDLELVVFSDIDYKLLIAMLSQCQLTINALNAINHRNNQISYRFNVSTSSLSQSRELLAQFLLKNTIEAALLSKAPQLSIPGLLVMDMDSTTIEIECIDEIAILAGVGEQVAAVTEQAMQGDLDFSESLHQRVLTLKGSSAQILADVAQNIPLMPGLKTLIQHLKEHNWRIAIASGGFTYFAEHLENMLGLDASFANQLEIQDGKLTGKVLGDVVDAQAKADSLNILSERYSISANQTVAMGDGANDLVMMASAYLGVAFHAKPIVLAQADSSINHQGLDCLLHWLK